MENYGLECWTVSELLRIVTAMLRVRICGLTLVVYFSVSGAAFDLLQPNDLQCGTSSPAKPGDPIFSKF